MKEDDNTDSLHNEESIQNQSRWTPYSTLPELMLHRWWLTDGKTLTRTGLDSLCKVVHKTIEKCNNVNNWPTSLYQIEKMIDIPYVSNNCNV